MGKLFRIVETDAEEPGDQVTQITLASLNETVQIASSDRRVTVDALANKAMSLLQQLKKNNGHQ